MSATTCSSRRRVTPRFFVQKPQGRLGSRVQAVGPERFAIVSVDCAKVSSRYLLADFYGQVLLPPTQLPHLSSPHQTAPRCPRSTARAPPTRPAHTLPRAPS